MRKEPRRARVFRRNVRGLRELAAGDFISRSPVEGFTAGG
jgi:hypothetical protein